MGDLVFAILIVTFFAVAVAYVKACDHIIGPDPALEPDAEPATDGESAVARTGGQW